MGATASPPGLRISLREFLLVITAVVIGCAALKLANEYWLIAISLTTVFAFIAGTIVAVIDRGSRQAFAIGFSVVGVIYGGLLHLQAPQADRNTFARNPEFDPYDGRFPTTRLMRPLFEEVSVNWYLDRATGKQINEYQLPPGAMIDGNASRRQGAGFGYAEETPSRGHFMPIGHCLWALLFGYAGGHFARWVYFRRLRDQNAAS